MNREQKCCFGCPPRIGTSALLWTTMVWCLVGLYLVNYELGRLHPKMGPEWDWLFQNYFYRCFVINLFIIVLIVCVVGLYGLFTKNARYLMPYLVYRTVVDILIVVGLFPFLLDAYLNPAKHGLFVEHIVKPLSIEKDNVQDSFDHVFILFVLVEFVFVAMEVHFLKVILSCCDLMESSARMCKNEVLFLSNLKGSSPNGKFYFTSEKEISTAV